MLRALIGELGWQQDRFVFTGPVPDDELAAYYRGSSVYISMSEHEGFCVPLLEAMAADLPILAYASTAVPDTLGGAGVQFARKDFEAAAEMLGMLAFDDDLRADVIAGTARPPDPLPGRSDRRGLQAAGGAVPVTPRAGCVPW